MPKSAGFFAIFTKTKDSAPDRIDRLQYAIVCLAASIFTPWYFVCQLSHRSKFNQKWAEYAIKQPIKIEKTKYIMNFVMNYNKNNQILHSITKNTGLFL